jgi:murein DD-endopeptidase MepM/ murein hydrolase activator NlpD
MAVATVTNLYGQGVVGQQVTCPWLQPAGPFEVTQGWGPTQVQSEPAEDRSGKHYSHWHAGVDVGCPTNTHIVMPSGLTGRAVYLDNPTGYGVALIIQIGGPTNVGRGQTQIVRTNDIYLGHLATRLVKDGATVRAGDVLAVTDSTGNSTGPHLHFEVRPPNGRYGTDIDPSAFFLQAQPAPFLTNPIPDIGAAITQAEQSLMNTVVGLAQTALGGSMMLAGGVSIGFGLRGMTPARALNVTRGTARGLTRRRAEFDLTRQRRQEAPQVSAAGRTRLRPTLRREVPQTAAPVAQSPAPFVPRTRTEAKGLVPMRYGVPIVGKEAKALRRALPRKAA